ERLHRALQPDIPRGGAGPAPVRPDRGRSRSGLLVDDRIQRGAAPRQPGRPDARRISPATDRRKFYFRSVCLTGKLTDRTPEGGLKPMTRTEHRLGENYKKNHPDL